jgi:predicted negative regulator of RcsB-dependent stress response
MDSTTTSTDNLLKFLAWLDKNKKQVSLIAGGTLVAVALIAGIIYYQSQKEVRASEALSDIRRPFNPAILPPTNVVQSYLKVAQEFSGTRAAGRALLEAASVLFTEGNFANAETQYRKFLSDYPDSPFLSQGMLGLASTLDAEGKTADAMKAYEELRRRAPNDSTTDETKLALARLTEKQNPAEAYKLYNELVSAGSQSGIGSEAGIRLSDLQEKYPELGKTNAPPLSPSTTISTRPGSAATVVRQGSSNQMVMTITNLPNRPSTAAPATASPTATVTSSAAPPKAAPPGGTGTTPLLIQPGAGANSKAP